jgi:hypothetical protein
MKNEKWDKKPGRLICEKILCFRHPGPDTVFRVKGKMMCGFGIGGLIAAPQAPARIFGEQ